MNLSVVAVAEVALVKEDFAKKEKIKAKLIKAQEGRERKKILDIQQKNAEFSEYCKSNTF